MLGGRGQPRRSGRARRDGRALGALALATAALVAPVSGAGACEPLGTGERAAQTLMTRLPGTSPNGKNRSLVKQHVGSILVSGFNIEGAAQLKRLTNGLRRRAPLGLLAAVNDEALGNEGLVDELSAREMARKHGSDFARKQGRRVGAAMRELGLDWNLSPVLDVASAGSFIGERAYSGDSGRVARYGTAYAEGLRAAGVETSGKHFPGHGRTDVDSHERMPTVRTPLEALTEEDLAPYIAARDALSSVMTSHIRYTAIDPQLPASLSPAVTDLLRRQVGFDGVLITDGLHMGAIRNGWSLSDAAVQSLVAGADVALTSNWHEADEVQDAIVDAVRSGALPAAQLDAAVNRVLRMKDYPGSERDCLLG